MIRVCHAKTGLNFLGVIPKEGLSSMLNDGYSTMGSISRINMARNPPLSNSNP